MGLHLSIFVYFYICIYLPPADRSPSTSDPPKLAPPSFIAQHGMGRSFGWFGSAVSVLFLPAPHLPTAPSLAGQHKE